MTIPQQAVHVDSPTECRNPRTYGIDTQSTADILAAINSEDQLVPTAVAAALPQLARAVDAATAALRAGGRVHYVGAGTSGRLASADAAELMPTFGVPPDWFVVHHAGGSSALHRAVEGAEDDYESGIRTMSRSVRAGDFAIGLAASGRTPYVLGALAEAHRRGAGTALVSGNPDTPRLVTVDTLITVETGPEVIAGSTRMKAGTAQKLVLTSFSTAVMIKLGRTYSNLMVSMRATNAKLRGRTIRILQEATGMSLAECADALAAANGELKVALVHLLSGADTRDAATVLIRTGGQVRESLELLGGAVRAG